MPDISKPWCGYDPDKFTISQFFYGICHDIFKDQIIKLKNSKYGFSFKPFVKERTRENDNFEFCYNSNLIIREKKLILSWRKKELLNNFECYEAFAKSIISLENAFCKATKELADLIVRSLILLNPSKSSVDDQDISRILGNYGKPLGTKKKLIRKCVKKFSRVYRNVRFYDPRSFSKNKSNFNREDGLFALGESINGTSMKLFQEESSHLWSGRKSWINQEETGGSNDKTKLTSKTLNNEPRVMASKDDLALYLNFKDNLTYEAGITRGEKTIDLDTLKKKVANIISLSGIKSGEAILIDQRLVSIEYLSPFLVKESNEKLKIYAEFIIKISNNCAGFLLKPSINFVETIYR